MNPKSPPEKNAAMAIKKATPMIERNLGHSGACQADNIIPKHPMAKPARMVFSTMLLARLSLSSFSLSSLEFSGDMAVLPYCEGRGNDSAMFRVKVLLAAYAETS
ncbi:MAG: hypothetical protein NTY36_12705 [Deltaproteobacteria bacterium]|nr:hypothetical protein [Deltaproteobacteria bacterium]